MITTLYRELRAAGRITTRSISPGGWRLIRDAIDAGAIVTGYGAVRYAHEGLKVASRYAHRQMRSYSRAEQQVSFDEHGY